MFTWASEKPGPAATGSEAGMILRSAWRGLFCFSAFSEEDHNENVRTPFTDQTIHCCQEMFNIA